MIRNLQDNPNTSLVALLGLPPQTSQTFLNDSRVSAPVTLTGRSESPTFGLGANGVVMMSQHAQMPKSIVGARHRTIRSVEALLEDIEDEAGASTRGGRSRVPSEVGAPLTPAGERVSKSGDGAHQGGKQRTEDEVPPLLSSQSPFATPTKTFTVQNSFTPSPGGLPDASSPMLTRMTSANPSPLVRRASTNVVYGLTPRPSQSINLWGDPLQGPDAAAANLGEATSLLHKRMTSAAYSLIEAPGMLGELAGMVNAKNNGPGTSLVSTPVVSTASNSVTAAGGRKKGEKKKSDRVIRFTYVRFNRVYARVSYQGYPLSFTDMKVVLDARVYQALDGSMRELFLKYLWDAIKSMLRSMARLQGRKFKDILPGSTTDEMELEEEMKGLTSNSMSVEVTPVASRGLFGFLRRGRPSTASGSRVPAVAATSSIAPASVAVPASHQAGGAERSAFVSPVGTPPGGSEILRSSAPGAPPDHAYAPSIESGLRIATLQARPVGIMSDAGGGQQHAAAASNSPVTLGLVPGVERLQGLVGEQLDMLKTALKHRQMEAKKKALLGQVSATTKDGRKK